MKIGDRIEVVSTESRSMFTGEFYFKPGDKAVLTRKDGNGDWWADFESRDWSSFSGDLNDKEFCLQEGFTEFKVI